MYKRSCLVVVFMFATSALAQDVRIELKGEKAISLGEMFKLRVEAHNAGLSDVILLTPMLSIFTESRIDFYLKGPGQEFRRIGFPVIYDGSSRTAVRPRTVSALGLSPGESDNWTFYLSCNFLDAERRQWLFSEPGTYTLKCVMFRVVNTEDFKNCRVPYKSAVNDVTSEEIEFEVMPLNDADQRAWKRLNEMKLGYLIYAPYLYSKKAYPLAEYAFLKFEADVAGTQFHRLAQPLLTCIKFHRAIRLRDILTAKQELLEMQAIVETFDLSDKAKTNFINNMDRILTDLQTQMTPPPIELVRFSVEPELYSEIEAFVKMACSEYERFDLNSLKNRLSVDFKKGPTTDRELFIRNLKEDLERIGNRVTLKFELKKIESENEIIVVELFSKCTWGQVRENRDEWHTWTLVKSKGKWLISRIETIPMKKRVFEDGRLKELVGQ